MNTFLRAILYWCAVKPFVAIVLGTQVHGIEHLPRKGPAIVVSNHNSHLDTLVLLSLFPFRSLHGVRPVAAGDYFLRGRLLSWFSRKIVRVIPIERKPGHAKGHPLSGCEEALARGDILAIFPEGSRGKPEEMAPFKQGVAHLVEGRPDLPVIPVFMSGTGRALPRGEALLVPHICKLSLGEPFYSQGSRQDFMQDLTHRFERLAQNASTSTGENHDPQQ